MRIRFRIFGAGKLNFKEFYGTFHHISKKHLDRYTAEFSFCWDNRKIGDYELSLEAMKGIEGKRLYYRHSFGK